MPFSQTDLLKFKQIMGKTNGAPTTDTKSSGWADLDAEMKKQNTQLVVKPAPQNQNQTGLLGAINKGGEFAGNVLGGASKFLFGSTAKTVGSLITQGIGSAEGLAGQALNNQGMQEQGGKIINASNTKENITPGNIAWTALELYPGGKLAEGLKAFPGGAKIVEAASKVPGVEQATELLAKWAEKLPTKMKEKAIQMYTNVINPKAGKELAAKAEKVAPGLIKRGITGGLEKIKGIAEAGVEKAGQALDTAWSLLPKEVKTASKPIINKLNALKNEYVVNGKIINQAAHDAFENVQKTIAEQGKNISLESLRKMRQIFDEHYNVAKKGLDDITGYTAKANRAAGDAIRAEISKASPDLAKLNAEYSFWKNTLDVVGAKAKKEAGKVKSSVIGGAMGAALGFETGQGILGKAINIGTATTAGAVIGPNLVKLFRSPGWKTLSAVERTKFANILATGGVEKAVLVMDKILAGGHNVFEGINE